MKRKVKRKNLFADLIIVICLSMSAVITMFNMYEYHRLGEVMPSGVISALLLLWGGELLILAVRQIFGSNVVEKTKGGAPTPQDDNETI